MADDWKNPYGKAAKGETKDERAARQKKFYTAQREHAENTNDYGTEAKIYDKLNVAKFTKGHVKTRNSVVGDTK